MRIEPEFLLAFFAACASLVSSVVVLFRWAKDMDRAKHEQLRREISNEIRGDIYRHLLELNMQWLSSSQAQRND